MPDIIARFLINWDGFKLDVDLSLPGKGVTVLFGQSGSGKTTLLRCIAGLEHAPQGFLSVNNQIWQDENGWLPTYKRPLGYVFQEVSLFPHLNVMGNLRYGLKRIGDKQQIGLDQAINLLGIEHLLARKPQRLSGGERQRVGIARALAVNPRILLMDEPLAALDVKRKQEILPYLDNLHNTLQIPILYVTHSPDEVARMADYLVVLDGGKVLAQGLLPEILTSLDLPIRLGEDAGTVIEAKIGSIDSDWHLARVDFSGGSLWTRDRGLPAGCKVRVRVLARDVSLARQHPGPSSIQNALYGLVDSIADDEHPGLALVRVRVGESAFIARLTKRSAAELGVELRQELWVLVKSVALIE